MICEYSLNCRQTGSPLHAATDTNVDDLNFTYLNENRIGNILEMHRDALHKSDRAKLDMSLSLKRAAEKMDHCHIDLRNSVRENPKHLKFDNMKKKIKEPTVLKHVELERPSRIEVHGHVPEDVAPDLQNLTRGASVATPSSAASTVKVEAQAVDPQLHLLDFQLRNILKPSSRTEECLCPGVHCTETVTNMGKGKSNNEEFNLETAPVHDKNLSGKANDDAIVGIMRKHCMDELLNNAPEASRERKFAHGRNKSGDWKACRSDTVDSGNNESVSNRLSRPTESVLRRHSAREENEDERETQERKEAKRLSLVDCSQLQHGHGSITFGNVEEISHTNVHGEDPPTTNVYLDDHATRAAPYTLASQFISLGFSDEEGGEDETESIRADELKGATAGRVVNSSYIERGVRSLHLHKQVPENGEKQIEKRTLQEGGWCCSLSQEIHAVGNNNHDSLRYADSEMTDVSVVPKITLGETALKKTEHKPRKAVHEDTPRQVFSTRSPSSPARLSSTLGSHPPAGDADRYHKHFMEAGQRLSRDNIRMEKENTASSLMASASNVAPLAVQEDDEDSISIGVEAQGMHKQQVVLLTRPGERGCADGESTRCCDGDRCSSVHVTDGHDAAEKHCLEPTSPPSHFQEISQYHVMLEACNLAASSEVACTRTVEYSDLDFTNKNMERCDQLDRLDNLSQSLSMPNVTTVYQGRVHYGVRTDLAVNADARSARTENSESSNLSEGHQHIIPDENSSCINKSSDVKSTIGDVHCRDRKVIVTQRLRDCRPIKSGPSDHQRSLSAGPFHSHPDVTQIPALGGDEEILSSTSSPERSYYPKPPSGSISKKSLGSSHARSAALLLICMRNA